MQHGILHKEISTYRDNFVLELAFCGVKGKNKTDYLHFYCRKCHKIINLDLPEGELNALIKNVPGLRIEGHCLTVTGVCAECASKE